MTSGGGGVKVGRRVAVGSKTKAAMSVGSMVGVVNGVEVGGGSMMGKFPEESETKVACTHPVPLGPDGKTILIQSRPGDTPSAAAVSPGCMWPMTSYNTVLGPERTLICSL